MKNLFLIGVILMGFGLFRPGPVLAQPNVCGFYGTVVLDEALVADGTPVIASVSGEDMGTAVVAGEYYSLKVPCDNCTGKTILFDIVVEGRRITMATAKWQAGENIRLDLNALTPPPEAVPAEIVLRPVSGVATNIYGQGFHPHRTVTIFFEDEQYCEAVTDGNGLFRVQLVPPVDEDGVYSVIAIDDQGRSASTECKVETLELREGPPGLSGETGPEGSPGSQGPAGKDANSSLGIAAFALAGFAVIAVAIFILKNRKRVAK